MGYDYSAGYVDTFDWTLFRREFPDIRREMKKFESKFYSATSIDASDLALVCNLMQSTGVIDKLLADEDYVITQDVINIAIGNVYDFNELDDNQPIELLSIAEYFADIAVSFKLATGLELSTFYLEDPMRGSEVDSFEWYVGGLYELSEAGKKYESMIRRKFYCC